MLCMSRATTCADCNAQALTLAYIELHELNEKRDP